MGSPSLQKDVCYLIKEETQQKNQQQQKNQKKKKKKERDGLHLFA